MGTELHKKCLLITMHYVDNYGSVLQTFASQLLFEKLGYNCKIIDYIRENNTIVFESKAAYSRYRQLGGFFSLPPVAAALVIRFVLKKRKRKKIFDKFRNHYLNLSDSFHDYSDLINKCPEADLYVVGSDQVWNYIYNGGFLPEYFLAFAPPDSIKISLSSSIGIEEVSSQDLKEFEKYLKDFSFISVREQSAVTQLSRINVVNPILALDPTLLITGDEWITHLSICKNTDKYVFVYQLNYSTDMMDFADSLALENDLNLIVITAHKYKYKSNTKRIKMASVKEFVGLIANASYVVTDSFHGTAFSINFSKDYFVFYPPKYSTRLESILLLTGTIHRHVNTEKWSELPAINYNEVKKIINEKRERLIEELSIQLEIL